MPGPGNAVLWVAVFGVGLVFFLLWELTQWRRVGTVLSRRQKVLRLVNIGFLGVILGLMLVGSMGWVRTVAGQLSLLMAILGLTFIVLALALRDWRELAATRAANEMRIAGDLARLLSAHAERQRLQAAGEASAPEDEAR